MQIQIIEELYLLVATAFRLESKAFDYELWADKINAMIAITCNLAQKYGADEEIVIIATLLHHFSALMERDKNDGSTDAGEAMETLLSRLGYPKDRIRLVKNCLAYQNERDDHSKPSAEQTLMADAYAFSHIQALASLFHEVYENIDVMLEAGVERIKRKLQRDWRELSEQGKIIYKEKYERILNAFR